MPDESMADASLVEKILAVHDGFVHAGIDHAFGGALALAYWTADPRSTNDIDVNVSVHAADAAHVLAALPTAITIPVDARARILADEQIRLRWAHTPVDIFFRAAVFHDGIAARAVPLPFASRTLPFVAADDLAVLKALFDRPKDWLDIAAMRDAHSIDIEVVIGRIGDIVGRDDARITRVRALGA